MDADHDIELQRAGRYDHPTHMFEVAIRIRHGKMPETLHWTQEELLSMTVDWPGSCRAAFI